MRGKKSDSGGPLRKTKKRVTKGGGGNGMKPREGVGGKNRSWEIITRPVLKIAD